MRQRCCMLLALLCGAAVGQEYFMVSMQDFRKSLCVFQEGNPNLECLIKEPLYPGSLAVDESDGVNSMVYWATDDFAEGQLKRKILRGNTEPEVIIDDRVEVVRVHKDFLYFGSSATVERIPLSNMTANSEVLYTGFSWSSFDLYNDTMYLYEGRNIRACDIENCTATLRLVASGTISPGSCTLLGGFKVDPLNKRAYWCYGPCSLVSEAQLPAAYYVDLENETMGAQLFVPDIQITDFAFVGNSVFTVSGSENNGGRFTVVEFDLNGNELSDVDPGWGSSVIVHCTLCGQGFNPDKQSGSPSPVVPFALLLSGIMSTLYSMF